MKVLLAELLAPVRIVVPLPSCWKRIVFPPVMMLVRVNVLVTRAAVEGDSRCDDAARRVTPPEGSDIEDAHRVVTHRDLDAIGNGDDRSFVGHGEGGLTGDSESHLIPVAPGRSRSRHQHGVIRACSKTDGTGDIADKASVGDHHPVVIAAGAHLNVSRNNEAGARIEDIERIVGVVGVRTDDGAAVRIGPRGEIGRLVRAIGADKKSLGIGLL